MLSDYTAMSTLGVSDLSRARQFYEGVLGFTPANDGDEGIVYASGTSVFFVYRSGYAGTNKATALSFQIPGSAFDDEVAALKEKGVEFQTYDMEGVTWTDGVASMGEEGQDWRSAWFEDPDGNILNLETESTAS